MTNLTAIQSSPRPSLVKNFAHLSKSSKQDKLNTVNEGLFNIITKSDYNEGIDKKDKNIKALIKFILTGVGDLPEEFKQFKHDIEILRTNSGGWLTEQEVTKSMIDLVAHIYIVSRIEVIKDNSDIETKDSFDTESKNGFDVETKNLEKAKNLFVRENASFWYSGFANNFRHYLNEIGIDVSKIPRSYINSIKYKNGYIVFNHYGFNLQDGSVIMKNSNIRGAESTKKIKQEKKTAVKYYGTIIQKITEIKDHKEQKQALLELTIINRTIDLTMRNLVDSKMFMGDLLKLAEPVFKRFKINTLEEKTKFIRNTIYIHYRQNNGIGLKKVVKGVVVAGAVIALGMSLGSMILTAFTVAKGVTAMLSLAVIVSGPVVEGIHDLLGFGGEVVGGLRRSLNAGDRINSDTESAKKIYSQLNHLYNEANSKISGDLCDKLPLSKVVPKKARLRELIETNDDNRIEILHNIMQSTINKSSRLRNVSLQDTKLDENIIYKPYIFAKALATT